jgi:hypothetical protein
MYKIYIHVFRNIKTQDNNINKIKWRPNQEIRKGNSKVRKTCVSGVTSKHVMQTLHYREFIINLQKYLNMSMITGVKFWLQIHASLLHIESIFIMNSRIWRCTSVHHLPSISCLPPPSENYFSPYDYVGSDLLCNLSRINSIVEHHWHEIELVILSLRSQRASTSTMVICNTILFVARFYDPWP